MTAPENSAAGGDRPVRPPEQEAVRTTIVGGRPPGCGKAVGPIPRGVEVLLKKAAVDPSFKTLLVEKRDGAAAEIGLVLDPAEALMLRAVPAAQLEALIAATRVTPAQRPAFLGRAAAVMLVALGAGAVAGCDWIGYGIRVDHPPVAQPDNLSGASCPSAAPSEPQKPPATSEPSAPPPPPSPTRGIQPDRPPAPKPPEKKPAPAPDAKPAEPLTTKVYPVPTDPPPPNFTPPTGESVGRPPRDASSAGIGPGRPPPRGTPPGRGATFGLSPDRPAGA